MSRRIDLAGKRFGRLLVIEDTGKRSGSSVVWKCRCDCGRTVEIPARNMLHRGTVSCGCNKAEQASINLSGDLDEKLGRQNGTNASRLASGKPQANNKAGFRGVSWNKSQHGGGKWIAVIYFKGKRYRLGFYSTPEEASKAYLRAKEQIHGNFLAWYQAVKHKKRNGGTENENHLCPGNGRF